MHGHTLFIVVEMAENPSLLPRFRQRGMSFQMRLYDRMVTISSVNGTASFSHVSVVHLY